MALTFLLGLGMASCSDNIEPDITVPGTSMLVKAPQSIAYSGTHLWNSTGTADFATRSADSFSDVVKYETVWKDPGDIDYAAETKTVSEILGEGTNNIEKIDVDFMYHAKEDISFEMYPVYQHTSHSPNYLGVFYYDNEGNLHQEIVWDRIDLYNLQDWQNNGGKSKGIKISIKKGYKFGFFIEGTDNSYQKVNFYSLSDLNPELDRFNAEGSSKTHAGTFEKNGKTYLCFEDWTDFDYQDIVFASFTKLPTVDSDDLLPDEEKPGTPDKPEVPEIEIPDTPLVPLPGETPDQNLTGSENEVEINLALDQKGARYLESHLSIHVRHATDVEVFIPVPVKYYCEADDMNIVINQNIEFVHGGPYITEYNVGSNIVYLNVEFKENGIKIFTKGITREVIEYCRDNYNDGITFEVWNYFNDPEKVGDHPLSYEELKAYMDQATVRFLDSIPDAYINAFGKENGKYGENGSPEGKDFHVRPDDQTSAFKSAYEGPHLNGSNINEIYEAVRN